MKAQSNIQLPNTPQRWKAGQFIFYYNHKDNGEQLQEKQGSRYEAEFTIVKSLDKQSIQTAITRALVDVELEKCVVNNIEVKGRPAIDEIKVYKPNASELGKINEVLNVIQVEPLEEI